MRKASLIAALGLATMLVPALGSAFIDETKLGMEMWLRGSGIYDKGFNTANAGEELGFEVARGYVDLQPKFNDDLKGRFTVDIFSAPIGSCRTTGTAPRRSLIVSTDMKKSAPMRSILLTKQMRGTLYLSA